MSEREGSQRERGATTAVRPEGRGPDGREERASSEREGSQRERGGLCPHPVFDFHTRLSARQGDLDRLLTTLDSCRIDRAAVSAGGTIDLGRLSRQLVEGGYVDTDPDNDAVLRACAASGGRLVPFFFANPRRGAEHYRERAGEFRGLEVSPAVHGVELTDRRTAELVSVAGDFEHPVYVVCLGRPGSGVADLAGLADLFADVTFVLGHSGVGNIDFYGVELVASRPNIVLETSGGYTSVLRAALDRLTPSRVLFGTEFPLQHPSVELAKFAALNLPADQWRQVAWDNAIRLLERSTRAADRHPAPAAR
jgi:predicted TIM-barrel fold metal-dependent hydrolase